MDTRIDIIKYVQSRLLYVWCMYGMYVYHVSVCGVRQFINWLAPLHYINMFGQNELYFFIINKICGRIYYTINVETSEQIGLQLACRHFLLFRFSFPFCVRILKLRKEQTKKMFAEPIHCAHCLCLKKYFLKFWCLGINSIQFISIIYGPNWRLN